MRIVQCTCLGKMGRFGNQLHQYAFARAYAEMHNAVLETPAWIGQEIFEGINDPLPSTPLEKMSIDYIPWGDVNIDLHGYFQKQAAVSILSRKKLAEWFKFKPEILAKMPDCDPYVAAHLRRGDFVNSKVQTVVSFKSYQTAFEKAGVKETDVLILSEEQPLPSINDLEPWIVDFLTMMRAKTLFRANSTFSWWAAALSGAEVYAPEISKPGWSDVPFVKGNWPRLSILTDHLFLPD